LKILVTGAAGFIGSHLTESLLQKGHQVIAVDGFLSDLYSEERKRVNWDKLAIYGNLLTRLETDLRFELDFEQLIGCDYVFHLAAMPGLSLSWTNPKLYIDCNVTATSNLLEASNRAGIKRFVYVSTSSVYGVNALGDESSQPNPISPYGVTKLAAENLVKSFANSFNMDFLIFRLFSVYGPRQRDDMAYQIFIKKLLNGEPIEIFGNGSQSRANTYVEDIVDGLLLSFEYHRSGEVFNLSGGEQNTLLKAVSVISEILEVQPKLIFNPSRLGDQFETKNVAQKASNLLGFEPKMTLKEGLRRQIKWNLDLKSDI
jgi:UDP-glucuronate 4-epimerase